MFAFRLPDLGLGNGIVRLLNSLGALRTADVVVVVCGLDGALASVVAGLVDAPVVCIPTSNGYGATLGGLAPLMAQLSCTTPGVSVGRGRAGGGGGGRELWGPHGSVIGRSTSQVHVPCSSPALARSPKLPPASERVG